MVFALPKPEPDEFDKEDVGQWTADKHHFLRRYIDAFTTSMKNKKWDGLHYVDLFSGPGIVQIRDGELDWGSPLIAAQAPHKFSRLHLCDIKTKNIEALNQRLTRYPQPQEPQVICGDANDAVVDIVATIPKGTLTLAFLDPHGLHLTFDTLVALSNRRADLIIFFPDHLDALRNWENVYQGNPDSNLDRVLGRNDWHKKMTSAPSSRWAEVLQELYKEKIRSLGYEYFEDERIAMPNGRYLYKLLFCANHPTAAQLWRRVSRQKRDGQIDLFE